MKLPFLHHANSTSPQPRATIDSESAVFFSRNSYTLSRPLISFLVRFLDFSRLILRLFLNGYRPQIRQGGERNLNGYWYVLCFMYIIRDNCHQPFVGYL